MVKRIWVSLNPLVLFVKIFLIEFKSPFWDLGLWDLH
jgi:hypothetical protein